MGCSGSKTTGDDGKKLMDSVKKEDNTKAKTDTNANGQTAHVKKAEVVKLEMTVPKPKVVFVLGGPGSGKGTQCANLVKQYGFIHLSAGDLLRDEVKAGGPNAEMIESIQKEGKLVPSEILVKIIKSRMENKENERFLIDGFPRNQENLDVWNSIINDIADVKFLLYFTCTLETMEKRLLKRGETSGRSDDNLEAIKKRFETFEQQTKPIAALFETQGKIVKLDAEREVDSIFEELQKVIVEKKLNI